MFMNSNRLLQEMLNSIEGIEVIFQEYILTKSEKGESAVYCFFEGNDYKYYVSRIKAFTSKEIIIYNCGGKNNVLTLHGMINANTSYDNNNTVLFFVDKDFDIDKVNHEDIYTTPCYSIENFYITDTAFCEFLKGELNISEYSIEQVDKYDFKRAVNYFKEKRNKFIKDVLMVNIWYSLQRKKSQKISKGQKPDLSNLKYINNITTPIDIEELKKLTPNYIEVNDLEIKNEEKRLMEDPLNNFRGKYYIEFLFKILNVIITDSNKPEKLFSKKRKINLTIGRDNLISVLSQYADTPECLKKYLKSKLTDVSVNNELQVSI